MTDKTKVKVVFRLEKDCYLDPIAVFNETSGKIGIKECYSHCGQHSSLCRGYYEKQTLPCKNKEEYQYLKNELESIGYDVTVCKRIDWRN